MTMGSEGKAPGPIRYFLACDRPGCDTRTMFDVVVSEPGPTMEDNFWGYLEHRTKPGADRAQELGWTWLQGDGHWCPRCSDPVDRAPWQRAGDTS
jgi:hypothetical protein